jgi:hypothetical protein
MRCAASKVIFGVNVVQYSNAAITFTEAIANSVNGCESLVKRVKMRINFQLCIAPPSFPKRSNWPKYGLPAFDLEETTLEDLRGYFENRCDHLVSYHEKLEQPEVDEGF